MRGNRLSILLPIGASLSPWIAPQSVRHHYPLLLTLLSLLLAGAAMLRKPGWRVERSVLLLLIAVSWPPALIASMRPVIDVGRLRLIADALVVVLVGLVARVMVVRATLPAEERHAMTLLERSFPELMRVVRVELGLFWFGLFRWRRNASDAPADAVCFPGTTTGTETALCLLTAAGFVIEMPLTHLLLAHVCNGIVAWICTALHLMLGIYLIGYAKSLMFRPTLLFADRLEIRLGVLARRVVSRASIETVMPYAGKTIGAGEHRLFGLDEPNLRLSAGGIDILFRVDFPERLRQALAA